MGSRYLKNRVPEFLYFVGDDVEGQWIQGPFVKPQSGNTNRKFKLIEVPMDEKRSKTQIRISSLPTMNTKE